LFQVPRDIFKTVPEAISCGYRFGTFRVYIDQNSDTPTNEIRAKIKPILDRHDIHRLELCTTERTMKQFSTYSVGNDVTVGTTKRKGSLGGFVVKSPNDQLCMLISKHIVSLSNHTYKAQDIDVTTDQNIDVRTRIARVLVPNDFTQQPLDIAVAKVDEEHAPNCERSFKSSDGRPQSSLLYEGEGQIPILSGLDVHVWGAMSKPGRGKISMGNMYQRAEGGGMDTFITVEDESDSDEEVIPFSKPGDSGAAICSDDPDDKRVNVISMLMGKNNQSSGPGFYASFSLTAGLNQLNSGHTSSFTIC